MQRFRGANFPRLPWILTDFHLNLQYSPLPTADAATLQVHSFIPCNALLTPHYIPTVSTSKDINQWHPQPPIQPTKPSNGKRPPIQRNPASSANTTSSTHHHSHSMQSPKKKSPPQNEPHQHNAASPTASSHAGARPASAAAARHVSARSQRCFSWH